MAGAKMIEEDVKQMEASLVELKETERKAAEVVEAANREKEAALHSAKAQVEKIVDKAHSDANEIKNKILASGREKVKKECELILSKAREDGAKLKKKYSNKVASVAEKIALKLIAH